MARPTKRLPVALRPRLHQQPEEPRPAPKAIEHLRPHLIEAHRTKPAIEKGTNRPALR